ncbi:MAG: hypothetical protein IT350_09835 [Deltaproteobacteria bacterium]|nr:hypothetical protein [Deltaproteobacteria bacterium]
MRVLVADDDPILLRIVESIVERAGFVAAVASDGEEALAKIREMEKHGHVPPEKSVKIVMATIHDDAEILRQATRGRCNGYFVKPVTPQAVGEILTDPGLIRG